MKHLVTLDEAFKDLALEKLEDSLFELNKHGIYDPEFLKETKKHLNSVEAIENLESLEPTTKTERIQIQ